MSSFLCKGHYLAAAYALYEAQLGLAVPGEHSHHILIFKSEQQQHYIPPGVYIRRKAALNACGHCFAQILPRQYILYGGIRKAAGVVEVVVIEGIAVLPKGFCSARIRVIFGNGGIEQQRARYQQRRWSVFTASEALNSAWLAPESAISG